MHTLHIKIDADIKVAGLDEPVHAPVINVPVSDPIGTALELGLQLATERAEDGNPEIIAKGSAKVPAFKIFGRQITIQADYTIDAEFWITSDDDAIIAQAATQASA